MCMLYQTSFPSPLRQSSRDCLCSSVTFNKHCRLSIFSCRSFCNGLCSDGLWGKFRGRSWKPSLSSAFLNAAAITPSGLSAVWHFLQPQMTQQENHFFSAFDDRNLQAFLELPKGHMLDCWLYTAGCLMQRKWVVPVCCSGAGACAYAIVYMETYFARLCCS